MTEQRYYKDREYGDWVAVIVGKHPLRTWYTDSYDLKRDWPDLTRAHRITSPPDGDPAWWYTGKRWRLEPARKMTWDREGIHAAFGLMMGVLLALALHSGKGIETALSVNAIAFVLFLSYEITEGLRLKDWAYRDIGGAMAGWLAPVSPAVAFYVSA